MKKQDYVEYRPVVIQKGVYDRLLKSPYFVEAIALYNFYYYTAVWQKTNQVRATEDYCLKGMNISRLRYRRARKVLFAVDLIKMVRRKRKNGSYSGVYTKLNAYATGEYLNTLPTSTESNLMGKDTTNAYKDNSLNAYSDNTNISKEILQDKPDKKENSTKTPVVEKPIQEKKPLVKKKENREITNLIQSLCEILNVPKLEGTIKDNRYMARHLLNDIEKAKVPIPQFFECFINCVEDTKEFRGVTSLREIRNKFPRIMKVGSDMRLRGFRPNYMYVKYNHIKGNNYIEVEEFQMDTNGNKIEREVHTAPLTDFDPEFLKSRGWL